MGKMSFAEKLKALFGKKNPDEDFYEEITDALIEGDVGAKTAFELSEALEAVCKKQKISGEAGITAELEKLLGTLLPEGKLEVIPGKTNIFMVLGVNGVGKTTTVAKLARYYQEKTGLEVVMAAADTFRAAAIDQLQLHGQRLGIRVVSHQMGSDPSSVVFDAADSIHAHGGGLVLADTAGRLHNKENLVRELEKIDRIARQKASEGCYHKILVVDSSTGQNALRQAEVFHEAVGLDAIVLTKCDGTAKGGVAFAIGKELQIPVLFLGTGEQYADLQTFDSQKYIKSFLGQ